VKSKQNKKNRKIEIPTLIKTSRNWFVVMPVGGGIVDVMLEPVEEKVVDMMELVKRVGCVYIGKLELEEMVELVVERLELDTVELVLEVDIVENVVVELSTAVG
jgi:hypothetical protein